jgi:Uncharacterized conserved protein
MFKVNIMSGEKRRTELGAFIEFLKHRCGFTFNKDDFDHRIMLQKYVFIAKFLGWNHRYSYNIYLRGPYSPNLADDYYSLSDPTPFENYNDYLKDMDLDEFKNVINEKDIPWLEIGTAILSLYDRYCEVYSGNDLENYLLEKTVDMKSSYENAFIEGVLEDLKRYSLIN